MKAYAGRIFLAGLLVVGADLAHSQSYPNKPIRIVTAAAGGGVDFVRSFSEQVYGIPPWQVIGSTFELRSSLLDGKVNLTRLPAVDFIDDGPGKPIGIARQIGKRPLIAFGNSDGDFEMLQYTTEGSGRRLGVLIRHDDLEREHVYERDTQVGRLARALDAAPHRKWLVVSMKNDWSRIFA